MATCESGPTQQVMILRSQHFTYHMDAVSCMWQSDFWSAFNSIDNTICDLGRRSWSGYHPRAYCGYGVLWFGEIEKVKARFVGFFDELRELNEIRAAYKRRI
ncbi:MAG: hypothetical protein Q9207_008058 [Kuettlingeria erythrocarpa]